MIDVTVNRRERLGEGDMRREEERQVGPGEIMMLGGERGEMK